MVAPANCPQAAAIDTPRSTRTVQGTRSSWSTRWNAKTRWRSERPSGNPGTGFQGIKLT